MIVGRGCTADVHPQLLHPLDVACVQLVAVDERPAQVPDRELLVDLLDLVEEAVGRSLERRVRREAAARPSRSRARFGPTARSPPAAAWPSAPPCCRWPGRRPLAVGEASIHWSPWNSLISAIFGSCSVDRARRVLPIAHRHEAVEPFVQLPLRAHCRYIGSTSSGQGPPDAVSPDGVQLADHGHAVGLEVPLVRLRDVAPDTRPAPSASMTPVERPLASR